MMPLEKVQDEQDKAYQEWHDSDQGTFKSVFLYGRYDAFRKMADNLEEQSSPGTRQLEK